MNKEQYCTSTLETRTVEIAVTTMPIEMPMTANMSNRAHSRGHLQGSTRPMQVFFVFAIIAGKYVYLPW